MPFASICAPSPSMCITKRSNDLMDLFELSPQHKSLKSAFVTNDRRSSFKCVFLHMALPRSAQSPSGGQKRRKPTLRLFRFGSLPLIRLITLSLVLPLPSTATISSESSSSAETFAPIPVKIARRSITPVQKNCPKSCCQCHMGIIVSIAWALS